MNKRRLRRLRAEQEARRAAMLVFFSGLAMLGALLVALLVASILSIK